MKKIHIYTILISCVIAVAVLPAVLQAKELNWIGHWKGEFGRQVLVEDVKKEFEFLHPDVKVNLVYDVDLEAPGDYFKKRVAHTIVEMIRSGDIKWDVTFLGVEVYNYVAEMLGDPDWGRKHLLDYGSIPGFNERHKEFILNTPYYREQTGGIFVGPMIEGLYACLWYNSKVAGQLGMAIPTEGMTTDQFLGFARELSKYNEKAEVKIPFLSFSTFYRIESLFEFIFKSHFNDPQTVVELDYNREKAEAFLETLLFFEELARYQPILNEGWREFPVFPWIKDYLAGNQGLFAAGGTYWYGHFRGNAPDDYTNGIPVEPPVARYRNGIVGQYSNVWAIMKNSPNQQDAIELLQLWSEPKIAEKWVENTKNPTGLRGHLSSVGHEHPEKDLYRDFVVKMARLYDGMPMRNYRSPMYVFGKDCRISGLSFRENLALILEGRKNAREYFAEVMALHGKSLEQ